MTDQTSPSATGEVQTTVAPPLEHKSRAQIARELFGSEYKGEVPAEPKPEEKTEEPEPVDTKADEEPPAEEEPAEGGEPKEGDEETAPEETSEIPIATLSELAEHFELDPAYVQTLKVPVNVDGIPTEATIGDLIKSYQLGEAAEHRLEKAKAFTQQQGEAWAAKHQELETQFQVLAEMIKLEDANLQRDMKAVDPKLRDEDPAEWSARIQEFEQRRAQIAQMKHATVEKYKTVADQRARESEEIKNQFMAEEHKVLLGKIPEWQDQTRADTEKAEIANYLVQSGFQPQELSNLIDHRQVMIARKAMLYDKSRGQVDTAKKRVATVPKIMKSGAPKPAEQRASERIAALKAKLAQTGTVEDALAYRLAKRGVR